MHLKRFVIPAVALLLGVTGLTLAPAAHAAQGPPPGYDWSIPPREFDAIRQQGFHDGIEGARKDAGNGRRPDVNNRDEYRHPNLPPEQRRAYRAGFRRGYQVGVAHLMGGGPGMMMPPPPPGRWDMAPSEFDQIRQAGFRDGMDGARKDFENHRQPNVENRDEFRNPHLPYEQRDAYRDGFRRGYDRAMDHLYGRPVRY